MKKLLILFCLLFYSVAFSAEFYTDETHTDGVKTGGTSIKGDLWKGKEQLKPPSHKTVVPSDLFVYITVKKTEKNGHPHYIYTIHYDPNQLEPAGYCDGVLYYKLKESSKEPSKIFEKKIEPVIE